MRWPEEPLPWLGLANIAYARKELRTAQTLYEEALARDAADAAEQLQQLLTSGGLWTNLVARGKTVLAALPTPRRRYEEYVGLLHRLRRGEPLLAPPTQPLRNAA